MLLWQKIFKCNECQLRKQNIWPSPFFVGEKYESNVLFIAQNPGWHHYHYELKKPNRIYKEFDDKDYINIQKGLEKECSSELSVNYFKSLMQSILWELRVDRIWRGLIKSGIKSELKNIAFTNLVKCSTKNNKRPSAKMLRNCKTWIEQEINALKPTYIIFIGKFAYDECPMEIKEKLAGKNQWIYHTSGRQWSKNKEPEIQKKINLINEWL